MKNIKDLIVHEKYQKKEKKRNYSSASIKQFKDSLNLSTSKQFFLSVSSSNIDGYAFGAFTGGQWTKDHVSWKINDRIAFLLFHASVFICRKNSNSNVSACKLECWPFPNFIYIIFSVNSVNSIYVWPTDIKSTMWHVKSTFSLP